MPIESSMARAFWAIFIPSSNRILRGLRNSQDILHMVHPTHEFITPMDFLSTSPRPPLRYVEAARVDSILPSMKVFIPFQYFQITIETCLPSSGFSGTQCACSPSVSFTWTAVKIFMVISSCKAKVCYRTIVAFRPDVTPCEGINQLGINPDTICRPLDTPFQNITNP